MKSQVDNLTAGCVKAGLKVVRIGRPEATRFDLEKYNLLEMVKVWKRCGWNINMAYLGWIHMESRCFLLGMVHHWNCKWSAGLCP